MNLEIVGRHIEITPAMRDFAFDKLRKLEKLLDGPLEVHLVLLVEKHRQLAEIQVKTRTAVLSGAEETGDLFASIPPDLIPTLEGFQLTGTFSFDLTSWGWVHLIVGVLVAVAGVFVLRGAVWARTVGVAVAAVSALLNFMWLPYYPVWSILIIAVDVLVIWALTAHGRDITR